MGLIGSIAESMKMVAVLEDDLPKSSVVPHRMKKGRTENPNVSSREGCQNVIDQA